MTKPAMNRMFLDITKKNEDDEQGDAMEEGEGDDEETPAERQRWIDAYSKVCTEPTWIAERIKAAKNKTLMITDKGEDNQDEDDEVDWRSSFL